MRTFVLTATLLTACGAQTPEAAPPASQDTPVAAPAMPDAFAQETGVTLDAMTRLESGVWIQDVRNGAGAAVDEGSTVIIDYTARLPDGTVFEQRPGDGWGPAEFVVEPDAAPVPGLAYALHGMRTGGTRRVVIPPELGYGLLPRPDGVPRDATLVFEIRLRSVR